MSKKLVWIRIKRGILASVWSEQGLYELTFPYPTQQEAGSHLTTTGLTEEPLSSAQQAWLQSLTTELSDYFAGRPVVFSVPIDWSGYSEFRLKALQFTAAIPAGQVATYGGVATAVGRPGAARTPGTTCTPCPVSSGSCTTGSSSTPATARRSSPATPSSTSPPTPKARTGRCRG